MKTNLISLSCLNYELTDLYRFHSEQSSFLKWCQPNFVISAAEMMTLRESLLTKIDVDQSLKTQKDDEYKQLNRVFLESKLELLIR